MAKRKNASRKNSGNGANLGFEQKLWQPADKLRGIAPARGTSSGGKITLLPGQSRAEEFATLAHEIAHEMMHRDERRSSTSKRIRETEAEAVAFVVCGAIGLQTGSAAQDYIGLYGGDTKLLSESLEYVQRTATQILSAIGVDESSALPA